MASQPQLGCRVPDSAAALRLEPVPAPVLADSLALAPVPVREDRLAEQLEDAAALPFRLADGPLLRLYHWRTSARSVYQLVVHHMLTDLWSLGLLFGDVAARYAAAAAGTEAGERPGKPTRTPAMWRSRRKTCYLRRRGSVTGTCAR